jgi:hypothetical protein
MARAQFASAFEFISQFLRRGPDATDGQLVEAFLSRRDEAAFTGLVQRHGPMVLGVCRQVLRDHAAADDAFQATFLVLARKAGSIRRGQAVSSWLYQVAHRVALRARAQEEHRHQRERETAMMRPSCCATWKARPLPGQPSSSAGGKRSCVAGSSRRNRCSATASGVAGWLCRLAGSVRRWPGKPPLRYRRRWRPPRSAQAWRSP